jgi:hypothetical protein
MASKSALRWGFVWSVCYTLLLSKVQGFNPISDTSSHLQQRQQHKAVPFQPLHQSTVPETPPVSKPDKDNGNDDNDQKATIYDMSEQKFKTYTRELCERRNLNLQGVKNARDLVCTRMGTKVRHNFKTW